MMNPSDPLFVYGGVGFYTYCVSFVGTHTQSKLSKPPHGGERTQELYFTNVNENSMCSFHYEFLPTFDLKS